MSLTLKRSIAPPSDDASRHTWPLMIECLAASDGFPPKMFVYHRDIAGVDTFSCVASVQQLRELPEDAPTVVGDQQIPFFRKSAARFECRNEAQQMQIWEDTLEQAKAVFDNWRLGSDLTQELTVEIL
jgi:hypothetical protein